MGAFLPLERGLFMEGMVPMAIAPSVSVYVGICLRAPTVTRPWDCEDMRWAKAAMQPGLALSLETEAIVYPSSVFLVLFLAKASRPSHSKKKYPIQPTEKTHSTSGTYMAGALWRSGCIFKGFRLNSSNAEVLSGATHSNFNSFCPLKLIYWYVCF